MIAATVSLLLHHQSGFPEACRTRFSHSLSAQQARHYIPLIIRYLHNSFTEAAFQAP